MQQATIIFDGECALCNGAVRFIMRHDSRRVFRFLSLQAAEGLALARAHGIDPVGENTLVLVTDNEARVRSDAVLAIARQLDGRWRLLGLLSFVPRCLRDAVYRVLARYRHALFGRAAACPLPVRGEVDPLSDPRSTPSRATGGSCSPHHR